MALMVDNSGVKYFCKICKKGFGCGRALGGHMRAHGISDENSLLSDDETGSDWDDKSCPSSPRGNKHVYALRANPNRSKSCRVCQNCGKEFLSWKSFLEHGKCGSEEVESLVSSPELDGENMGRSCGWSKRKRSVRTEVENYSPNSEEEDLANCLMMLSNARYDPLLTESEESRASGSKDEDRKYSLNYVAPLDYKATPVIEKAKEISTKGLFECKACKKVFNSHQALGGHRASHKKVKGCFAARLDQSREDSQAGEDVMSQEEFFPTKHTSNFQLRQDTNSSPTKKKSKVHECSICHRIFSSGQALGGHKRCHWITSNSPDPSSLAKYHQLQSQGEKIQKESSNPETLDLTLELNLSTSAYAYKNGNNCGLRNQDPHTNPSIFGVSTEMYLKTRVGNEGEGNDESNMRKINNNTSGSNVLVEHNNTTDDEANSQPKLAKLCELKDTNIDGNSSQWLQVGLASTV